MFIYVYSFLTEKEIYDCWKISVKLVPFIWRSLHNCIAYSDFWKRLIICNKLYLHMLEGSNLIPGLRMWFALFYHTIYVIIDRMGDKLYPCLLFVSLCALLSIDVCCHFINLPLSFAILFTSCRLYSFFWLFIPFYPRSSSYPLCSSL